MTEKDVSVAQDILTRIEAPDPPPFALIHRAEGNDPGMVDLLIGEITYPQTLADIDLSAGQSNSGREHHQVLTLAPYRQIVERGLDCTDDGAPLIALNVTDQATIPIYEAEARLPEGPINLSDGHFDIKDDAYSETVRRVVTDEIGSGAGANFVIKRSYLATIDDYSIRSALAFFSALLRRETGAYWTFLVYTGKRTFVGASPERQVSLRNGRATMNPISGTYRYPLSGPKLDGILEFLADNKESNELYMVVDEELKMMARICDGDVRVLGPHLKEMAHLAHTEYFIEGETAADPREILRETMFAPTVTGSPLENACRVIGKYEPKGRGYYSGSLALIGRDDSGSQTLDSSILIRTADISNEGRVEIGVGATFVRDSDPESEVAETSAKAAGLLSAVSSKESPQFAHHPDVRAALVERNSPISNFWLERSAQQGKNAVPQSIRRVLVVDAEDTFTSMLGYQLRSLGLEVTVRRFDESYSFEGNDLVIVGPGPGDPRDTEHPKIRHLRSVVEVLLAEQRPFIAVCLSHQVLSVCLGLDLFRKEVPNQGVQKEIDFFGARERVGFYNTYAANGPDDKFSRDGVGVVEVSRDPVTGEVHALRGPHFSSMQFHSESVLTQDGLRIIAEQVSVASGA